MAEKILYQTLEINLKNFLMLVDFFRKNKLVGISYLKFMLFTRY